MMDRIGVDVVFHTDDAIEDLDELERRIEHVTESLEELNALIGDIGDVTIEIGVTEES